MKRRITIPPMLSDLVLTGIAALDGTEFDRRKSCPECGGPLSGYDWKSRTFATIEEGKGTRNIVVRVKRFSCGRCGNICSADAPFYPDTRVGAPVVDLCRVLGREMPFSRAAAYLAAIGIVIDRGSCRNYANRDSGEISTTEIFGRRIPSSVLSLSLLAGRCPEGSPVPGAEALAACGFPPAFRAAPYVPVPPEKRDERDNEEQEKEREPEQE